MFKDITKGVIIAQILFAISFIASSWLIWGSELSVSYYGVMSFGLIGIALSGYTMYKNYLLLGLMNIVIVIIAFMQFLFVF